MEAQLDQILDDVIATKDDYALQSFVSELERSGAIEKIVGGFPGSGRHSAGTHLMEVVAEARKRVEHTGKAAAAAGAH
jgi:hypothetical protein